MSEFVYRTDFTRRGHFVRFTLRFLDGDMERVEMKLGEEVLSMSPQMFFAIFGDEAHYLYDQAATEEQNERLSS